MTRAGVSVILTMRLPLAGAEIGADRDPSVTGRGHWPEARGADGYRRRPLVSSEECELCRPASCRSAGRFIRSGNPR